MLIGRVIGDVVATQKSASHEGRKILVVQPLNLDGSDRGEVVLALDAVDDVRAAHAALRERGVAFTVEPRAVNPPMWAANFNDPDGHRLSIYGPEKKP